MYRGRFAPSPTGPLHFGSLVTAVASYLHARCSGGRWLVRIEDLDMPRCVPGVDEDILRTLTHFGFVWDEPVVYQSTRQVAYQAALDELERGGWIYPCTCSRKEVGSGPYPGTCRGRKGTPEVPHAIRVRVDDPAVEGGDFVVRRSDGFIAYQLAVVVDDFAQGITDVVRGADLLDSTPRQMYLQRLLGYASPNYLHVPVVVNAAGEKLSKQTMAPALDWNCKWELLQQANSFLASADTRFACTNWRNHF